MPCAKLVPARSESVNRCALAHLGRAVAAVVLGVLAAAFALPAMSAQAAPPPLIFGLGDHTDSERFATEGLLDKKAAVVGSFATRTNSPNFWGAWARQVRAGGAVLQLFWDPTWGRKDDPHSTLRSVLRGEHDEYIKTWAAQVRDYGAPVIVRLWAEMNGSWQPYSPGVNGNAAAEFAPAWRRVVDLARGVGANNILWDWNPDKPYSGSTTLSALWPGSSYVDWVGLDVYTKDGRTSFSSLMAPAVAAVRAVAGNKPLMINEIGCNDASLGHKADWVADMFAQAPRFGVKAVVYFDYNMVDREGPGTDWRLSSPSSVIPKVRAAVHAPGVIGAGDRSVEAIEDSFTERHIAANAPGDFTGSGVTSLAAWNPATGAWTMPHYDPVVYGQAGDVPVPADYTGGGVADRAVYRPSTGTWYVQGLLRTTWGVASDVPVPADYTGDRKADLAVWRPSTGTWWVRGQAAVRWGQPGDLPVPGDYNGDGRADLAVFRPSTGTWWVRGATPTRWGQAGDVPVPGDYNGDSRTDRAVYRPSTGAWWYLGTSTVLGHPGSVPVPGDYASTGRVAPAVLDPATMTWEVAGRPARTAGNAGEQPAAALPAVRLAAQG